MDAKLFCGVIIGALFGTIGGALGSPSTEVLPLIALLVVWSMEPLDSSPHAERSAYRAGRWLRAVFSREGSDG